MLSKGIISYSSNLINLMFFKSFISEFPLGNTGRGENKMNKERKVQVKGVTKQVTARA